MLAAVVAGCASVGDRRDRSLEATAVRCERALAAIDAAVAAAGVGDAEAARMAGFPYLRSNRLLASFRDAPLDDRQFREWTGAMLRLDREARLAELGNLPQDSMQRLRGALRERGFAGVSPAALVEGCGNVLRARDLADAGAQERLRGASAVADDYDTWKRVAGLYALARIPFAAGVDRWQREMRAVFALPAPQQPVTGALVRYALAAPASPRRPALAQLLGLARARSALGLYDPAMLLELAPAYAPILEIDEASAADRVGRPGFDAAGRREVRTATPAIFVRAAQTRYRGRVLPQLVYTVWFPERPMAGATDLLGGLIDALVWRVTLDPDGEPLVFDTMHACGCYHLFFPTPRATLRPAPDSLDEHAFAPAELPRIGEAERVIVRVASGTHYVTAVSVVPAIPPAARRLQSADEESLRRLPDERGATRSWYGPDGIVPGSERGERYWFWPMGIREPGAMRQWGRHATAFVGRLHFDDADLLERYFVLDLPGR